MTRKDKYLLGGLAIGGGAALWYILGKASLENTLGTSGSTFAGQVLKAGTWSGPPQFGRSAAQTLYEYGGDGNLPLGDVGPYDFEAAQLAEVPQTPLQYALPQSFHWNPCPGGYRNIADPCDPSETGLEDASCGPPVCIKLT